MFIFLCNLFYNRWGIHSVFFPRYNQYWRRTFDSSIVVILFLSKYQKPISQRARPDSKTNSLYNLFYSSSDITLNIEYIHFLNDNRIEENIIFHSSMSFKVFKFLHAPENDFTVKK